MKNTLIVCAVATLFIAGCGRDSSYQGSSDSLSDTNRGGTNSYEPQRQPDNSGINKRDRGTNTLTSGDQSESESDRELTRRIRQAIVKNDQLSMTADNIKIITVNGKVTLRGPVRSQEELQRVASIVQGTAGVTAVDNQLEVKQ